MCKMNSIENQLRNIIMNNVPKNIDLSLPLKDDVQLQAVLKELIQVVNDTNKRVQNLQITMSRINMNIEQKRIEDSYRAMVMGKKEF